MLEMHVVKDATISNQPLEKLLVERGKNFRWCKISNNGRVRWCLKFNIHTDSFELVLFDSKYDVGAEGEEVGGEGPGFTESVTLGTCIL